AATLPPLLNMRDSSRDDGFEDVPSAPFQFHAFPTVVKPVPGEGAPYPSEQLTPSPTTSAGVDPRAIVPLLTVSVPSFAIPTNCPECPMSGAAETFAISTPTIPCHSNP